MAKTKSKEVKKKDDDHEPVAGDTKEEKKRVDSPITIDEDTNGVGGDDSEVYFHLSCSWSFPGVESWSARC